MGAQGWRVDYARVVLALLVVHMLALAVIVWWQRRHP